MVPSAKGAVMPRTSPYRIVLTEDERRRLEAAARRYTSPYREVVRARIVLYAAEGLGNDEIKPWRVRSWIFPRDPAFAAKAGRVLDLYAGTWDGMPLGDDDYVVSADEKTSIQAR